MKNRRSRRVVKLELVVDEVDQPWSPEPEWEAGISAVLSTVSAVDPVLQVVLTNDETLREHNREYRGLDRPTDVLSFSYLEGHESHAEALLPAGTDLREYLDSPSFEGEPLLVGQILISTETVCERGAVHTAGLDEEMTFMVVHGLLHVLGFDHADEVQTARMGAEEDRLMAALGYSVIRRGEAS
jgi:probable rRNA maturation factor